MHLSMIVCVAIFACASSQVRHTRDVSWDRQIGKYGKIFWSLGRNNEGLFGTGGYKQEFLNDHRGKLEGQAYGNYALGWGGITSDLGGRLDFSNKNASAAVNLDKQYGGKTSVSATGAGVWDLTENTHLVAGGHLNHSGRANSEVAMKAEFSHNY